MKRLALVALLLAAACEKNPSKLDGMTGGRNPGMKTSGGTDTTELEMQLKTLSDRVAALETAHKPGAHAQAPGANDPTLSDRTHNLETSFAKYGEALDFLNQVYAQQKAQQEMQEAQELDPSGTYAVDITGPLKAGQVEGSNSAIVTVVEAWDFA
ncbi:MAG TPA: hypothetical protein VFQ53_04365 [Kofleriaceae bacterium]|nr:hypothetical protein [Kofleriaceae bacterium]